MIVFPDEVTDTCQSTEDCGFDAFCSSESCVYCNDILATYSGLSASTDIIDDDRDRIYKNTLKSIICSQPTLDLDTAECEAKCLSKKLLTKCKIQITTIYYYNTMHFDLFLVNFLFPFCDLSLFPLLF